MSHMKAPERKAQILEEAYKMASEMDLLQLTAYKIGQRLKLSHTMIFFHFGTINALREAVGRQAIAERNHAIILKLLASGMLADEIPAELRREVALKVYQ